MLVNELAMLREGGTHWGVGIYELAMLGVGRHIRGWSLN